MKKLLLFVTMLLPMVANAEDVMIEGIYYKLIAKGKIAEVIQNPQEYSGDIVIPSSILLRQ